MFTQANKLICSYIGFNNGSVNGTNEQTL